MVELPFPGNIVTAQEEEVGRGNRGKTNCRFPPFPQPILLLLAINIIGSRPRTIDDRLQKTLDLPSTPDDLDLTALPSTHAASQHLARIDRREIAAETTVGGIRIGYDELSFRRVYLVRKAVAYKSDVRFACSVAEIYFGKYASGLGHIL